MHICTPLPFSKVHTQTQVPLNRNVSIIFVSFMVGVIVRVMLILYRFMLFSKPAGSKGFVLHS